jgi:hypothetical protein
MYVTKFNYSFFVPTGFSMYTIVHIAEICYIIKLQEKLMYFKLVFFECPHRAVVWYSQLSEEVHCLHFQDDRNGSKDTEYILI